MKAPSTPKLNQHQNTMKEAIYNKRGTKQIVNSGWKLFDKQTNSICTGNALCNTQASSFIRPWGETKCNGHDFAEGHLMKFDLEQFSRFRIPSHIEDILRDKERKESVILYMFFTNDKSGRINPFCWVLTDRSHKRITDGLTLRYGEQYGKRESARREILQYITD